MKTSDFDYNLPEESIAVYPLSNREESKLLLIKRNEGVVGHKRFYDLPALLRDGDVLVLNDTKVIPARLFGKARVNDKFEVLLLERVNPKLWKSMMRNPKHGMIVEFESGLKGKILRNGKEEWLFEFEDDPDNYIEHFGKMPLPPYIKREAEDKDRLTYQTVYAKKDGAAAAPTAGLHFTDNLLREIGKRGVEITYVTLHVGAGTFQPVKTDDILKHKMHSEHREITEETATIINKAKREGRRIIAVGTTVVRSLESAVDSSGNLQPASGYTELFIYPGFRFQVVDALITNFHLPRSTLLILVSAFAGKDVIASSYEEAIREKYRLLSYGDSMLIF